MKHWEQKKFKDGKTFTVFFEPRSVWKREAFKLVAEPESNERIMFDLKEQCSWIDRDELLATFKEAIKWIEGLK